MPNELNNFKSLMSYITNDYDESRYSLGIYTIFRLTSNCGAIAISYENLMKIAAILETTQFHINSSFEKGIVYSEYTVDSDSTIFEIIIETSKLPEELKNAK